MANIDDMKRYIQHQNGKFYKNNKYDIISDKGMVEKVEDILWYSYNKASMQQPYANNALIPSYLLDKSLDIMYAWHLSLLLNISYICFKVVNVKANTINELNSISTFNCENSLVLFYNQQNHDSLIMKFLQSYRNSIAHGGFNKLDISGKTNEVYYSADSLYSTNGAQLSLRLIDDGHKSNVVTDVIAEIISHDYSEPYSLFNRNLELSGNTVVSITRLLFEKNGKKTYSRKYIMTKDGCEKILYVLGFEKIEEIKEYILFIYDELTLENLHRFDNISFYIEKYTHYFNIETIIEYVIYKKFKLSNAEQIELFVSRTNFRINIIRRNEFYLL